MIHTDADTADGSGIVVNNTLGEDAQVGGSFALFVQGKEMPGLLVGIVNILVGYLLDDEDLTAQTQDGIEFGKGQFIKLFEDPVHISSPLVWHKA